MKKPIYIKKVNLYQKSDQIRPFLIKIDLKSICWNRFHRDDSKSSNDEFGSKKSIKMQFEYDLKQILAGGRYDRISLNLVESFDQIYRSLHKENLRIENFSLGLIFFNSSLENRFKQVFLNYL